jgi:transcriptional regulator with XRE-family HTH domain
MSFRISLPQHERDGARLVGDVSRGLQKALAEEERDRGLKQSDIARTLGIDRATVSKQIHGELNMTLFRVGQYASAMGRVATISFDRASEVLGSNFFRVTKQTSATTADTRNLLPASS